MFTYHPPKLQHYLPQKAFLDTHQAVRVSFPDLSWLLVHYDIVFKWFIIFKFQDLLWQLLKSIGEDSLNTLFNLYAHESTWFSP